MNAIPHDREDSRTDLVREPAATTARTLHSILETRRRRQWHQVEAWLSQSPFYKPFRKATAPLFQWLAEPTNSIVAIVLLILAPFIALLLLPLFLILIPVFLFLAVLGTMASTVQTDADADEHESVTQHFLH